MLILSFSIKSIDLLEQSATFLCLSLSRSNLITFTDSQYLIYDEWLRIEKISNFLDKKNLNAE